MAASLWSSCPIKFGMTVKLYPMSLQSGMAISWHLPSPGRSGSMELIAEQNPTMHSSTRLSPKVAANMSFNINSCSRDCLSKSFVFFNRKVDTLSLFIILSGLLKSYYNPKNSRWGWIVKKEKFFSFVNQTESVTQLPNNQFSSKIISVKNLKIIKY